MKKIVYYSLCAVALAALSSCQEDIVEEAVIPAQTGDEITFGSELDEQLTKTIYGDLVEVPGGTNYYPVKWEDGDHISIYCPEAAQTKIVKYKITPDPSNASTSSAVTKVNPDEAGLQWGDAPTHHFSAFYPGDRILGSVEGKLRAEIPVRQEPVRWEKDDNTAGGITYTGVANTDYAFMWAYGTHDKSDGGDVALTFKPWVTILDVEINGPANAGESIKMSSVQLRSLSGETLNGEFLIDFNPVEDNESNYPIYIESGNPNATRSQISIQLYDDEWVKEDGTKGDFITLNHGDKIVVRFYLLPKDVNYDTSGEGRNDLQIRVTPFNSAVLTRTLDAQEGTVHGGILAHKVNKVILPSVSKTGPNDWMSSLNPGIYVTELSLPGSKMSYQTTENGANLAYQNLTIEEQMNNGIRAFQIQTASEDTYDRYVGHSDASYQHLRACVAGSRTNIPFSDIVKDIADGLKRAEGRGHNNEYAFILLTMSESACDSYDPSYSLFDDVSGKEAWMEAIKTDLAAMAAEPDTYRLYTEEITPTTTIADVAGKIIIKVNYNDDTMANRLSDTDRIPAMFAQWGKRSDVEDFNETSAYAINAMRWGTSRNADSGTLKWFYHEATPVGYNNANGGEYGEPSGLKISNIEDMWERSITYYKNNEKHDMWFLNDIGGSYVNGGYSSGETQQGVDDWTKFIGPYATTLLQNRTADATLGIVLMNFADPANPYSGNLIQTIINNNFNFLLRTDGSAQAENYDAQFVNGGNAIGWD